MSEEEEEEEEEESSSNVHVTAQDPNTRGLNAMMIEVNLIAVRRIRGTGIPIGEEREGWEEYRRELLAEGFSGALIEQHKVCLINSTENLLIAKLGRSACSRRCNQPTPRIRGTRGTPNSLKKNKKKKKKRSTFPRKTTS
jgi:hypothetical protein